MSLLRSCFLGFKRESGFSGCSVSKGTCSIACVQHLQYRQWVLFSPSSSSTSCRKDVVGAKASHLFENTATWDRVIFGLSDLTCVLMCRSYQLEVNLHDSPAWSQHSSDRRGRSIHLEWACLWFYEVFWWFKRWAPFPDRRTTVCAWESAERA